MRRFTLSEHLYRLRFVVVGVSVAALVAFSCLALAPGLHAAPAAALTSPAAIDTGTATPSPTPTASTAADPQPGAGASGVVTSTLSGQKVRLDLPTSGKAVALAIYFHAEGENSDSQMDAAWTTALRAAGWAVASSEFHGNAWGSPQSSEDLRSLSTWAQTQSGAPVQLFVSNSMGALTSLNSIVTSQYAIPCWYGVTPVVDLSTVGSIAASSKEIVAAYGKVPTQASNPVNTLSKLPKATKYRVVTSAGDTVVPVTTNANALVSGLTAQGIPVTTTALTGAHASAELMNADDISTFAKGCTP